ncbi:RtcB family protein [Candidatus Parvarchaeota archaeon]|nr:RtcB family protein [Candidatus Parvarchaeota archaeon]
MKKISEAVWELEKEGDMNVPGLIFATDELFPSVGRDRTINQLKNVAKLPGIVKNAILMPDGHEGYGFPIGGVAAFDPDEGGVVSPGGIGYDINCGVRLIRTGLPLGQVRPKLRELVNLLFKNVPSGVGAKGRMRLEKSEFEYAVTQGAQFALEKGMARKEDLLSCEEYGKIDGADPTVVSDMAKKRGTPQFGTLGAGNHFLELQAIEQIGADSKTQKAAKAFGLEKGEVVVMIHCGSRGFGHQICDDYLRVMLRASEKYGINLPDRELCCAPLDSKEADEYFKAMKCAVNFAFCNRQVMTHWVRESFDSVFGSPTSDGIGVVYDVCHNIAKYESHQVDGKTRRLCVHRKGATRAFVAGRKEIPDIYRSIGQPVLIPGSMGTASYVLVGKKKGMELSWGSSCHGAGRAMSRKAAIESMGHRDIAGELAAKGIIVKATQPRLVAEEAPAAYKDVDQVVKSVEAAGISDIVARLVPIGVVKG